ncbi:hypothetical protein ScPMuIL_018712 [Solemya velum]
MASNKRKQDEKHLKMLREMAALPHNKQCFDCHQRGPTYVNMQIGSYVCTACSGILRGLNPPHRVKSISMASFSPDEMEFLKCHGNEFCRKVWLGLYDSRTGTEPDSREEQKVRDFMVQKYERKRFYVAPTEAMKDNARQMNEASLNKQPTTKPLKSLLGENVPKLRVHSNQMPPVGAPSATAPPSQLPPQTQTQTQTGDGSFRSPGQQSQSSQSSGSTTMDLLGDLGSDPFASGQPAQSVQSSGGFADFSAFGGQMSAPSQAQSFSVPSNPLQQMGTTPAPSVSNGGFGNFSNTGPPSQPIDTAGAKYAALADLFSDNTPSTAPSTVSVAAAPINWGPGATTNAPANPGAISWSNTPPNNTSAGMGMPWNTSVAAANTNSSNMFNSTAPNPFGGSTAQPVAAGMGGNPFAAGGGSGMFPPATASFGQQQPSTAGFGQASQAGFGQPAAGGFGQQPHAGGFGQPATAQAGFGAFPVGQGASMGAGGGNFGQFGMQNGGFGGGMPAGGQMDKMGGGMGLQQTQGFGTVGGGWNQMPPTGTPNPFMSAANQQHMAPRGNSTNPFL